MKLVQNGSSRDIQQMRREPSTLLWLNVPTSHGLLHWMQTRQAQGWLRPSTACAQPLDAAHAGACLRQAREQGFPDADAAIIATLRAAGLTAVGNGDLLPRLSWSSAAVFASGPAPPAAIPVGLYPLVSSSRRVQQVLDAGVRTVQLRIKRPPDAHDAWLADVRKEIHWSVRACEAAGARLYVNDHVTLARELGASGVHLGQEDLLALSDEDRDGLARSGLALGVSSHSLWELCRARALAPAYVACGPVWPTTTKDMPWHAQGEHNLRWWCRVAGAPVVAIGGVLGETEVEQASAWGADGVCLVRGLGERPEDVIPALQQALSRGRMRRDGEAPGWLLPVLQISEIPGELR